MTFVSPTQLVASVTFLPAGCSPEPSTSSFAVSVINPDGGFDTLAEAGTLVPDCDGDGVADIALETFRAPTTAASPPIPSSATATVTASATFATTAGVSRTPTRSTTTWTAWAMPARPSAWRAWNSSPHPAASSSANRSPSGSVWTSTAAPPTAWPSAPPSTTWPSSSPTPPPAAPPSARSSIRAASGKGPRSTPPTMRLPVTGGTLTCATTVDLAEFFLLEPNRTYTVEATYFSHATDGLGDYIIGTILTQPQTIAVGCRGHQPHRRPGRHAGCARRDLRSRRLSPRSCTPCSATSPATPSPR